MSKVAVLGLGAMGSGLARNLLEAGHEVVVYNRSAERAAPLASAGARRAESPRDAVAGVELALAMLTDDAASRAVWLHPETGALAGLSEGAIAVESSTLTPAWSRELAAAAAAAGCRFLDAPVIGTRPHVANKQLVALVGGEPATLEAARAILSVSAPAIHHVGPAGAGMVMKLAVNELFAVQVAAFAEVVGLACRGGIDEAKAVELLLALPVTSPVVQRVAGLMTSRSFAPNFPIRLVEKDLGYALSAAQAAGGRAPSADAARAVFAQAREAGHGDDDISGIAQLFLPG